MLSYFPSVRNEYYKKNIYPFVYKLVDNYIDCRGDDQGINIDNFSDSDISTFASILLSGDTSVLSDIIHEKDLYSFLIIAMRTEDTDDKLNWADKNIECVIQHFRNDMQLILEDVYNDQLQGRQESFIEELRAEDAILRRVNND